MTALSSIGIDFLIGSVFVVVAGLGYTHRGQPGAIPFTLLAALLAVMSVGIAIGRSGLVPDSLLGYTLFIPYVFASLAWLALAFDYTGRGPVITGHRAVGLAAFGVAVLGITALNRVIPPAIRPAWTLLINVVQVAILAAVGYGAVLVARSAISYGDLPRSGSLVLTTAGSGLIAITVAQILAPAVPYETVFTIAEGILAGIAALLLLSQVRYRVFETGASAGHLARETVLDELPAAVAITGRQNHLLDVNQAAEQTFDITRPDALGEPVSTALGFDPTQRQDGPVAVDTSEGRRQFDLNQLTLTERGGDAVGRAYLLQDVTERRTHEQRLDVLNRVLRHNLRNDLDAIRGFAEALERDDAAVDTATLATHIRETAREVATLGETLSRAERLLEADRLDVDPVDIDALVRQLGAAVGEAYPDATVTISTPADPVTLRTDRRILDTVLEETVENALEHTDAATPRVELSVERRPSGVVIAVRDNGPGIPEQERAVLLEGEERPLRHGSGLGLWLVYWGVVRLGGDLDFRENDPTGSIVSIRLPDR